MASTEKASINFQNEIDSTSIGFVTKANYNRQIYDSAYKKELPNVSD